jgi:hypothetical protein
MPTPEGLVTFERSRGEPPASRAGRVWRALSASAARSGRSRAAVALALARVWRRTGIRPGEALRGELERLPRALLRACTSKPALMALQDALNPPELTSVTEDKVLFQAVCEGLGIPVPRAFAVVRRGGTGWVAPGTPVAGRDAWLPALERVLPAAFVTKPARGVYGDAVTAWRRAGDDFVDHRGARCGPEGLLAALTTHPRHDAFLVQERLESHPDIARLTGTSTLQTVRVTTLADPDGGARVLFAEWKLVLGDQVVDNFRGGATGNLIAAVARDTGRLGPAAHPAAGGAGLEVFARHPVTGLPLTGAALPDWAALGATVLRAARLLLPLRTLGWDVGLTPRGPVLVEANRWWDPMNHLLVVPQPPGVAYPEVADAVAQVRAAARR